jgi:acylphosphatase
VGFRYSALMEAKRLGLTGWVRNDDDGSVEVHAEGDPADLSLFATWLDSGPPGAYVERVDLHPTKATGYYSDFIVEF